MNIIVYSGRSKNYSHSHFISEIIFLLAKENSRHKFILLSDRDIEWDFVGHENFKIRKLNIPSSKSMLQRFWWALRLPQLLEKLNTDVFLIFGDTCSLNTTVAQCMAIPVFAKPNPKHLKKATSIIVTSKTEREFLLSNHKNLAGKIFVIPPAVSKTYQPVDAKTQALIKKEYSYGKEFFLATGEKHDEQWLIYLLKAFSRFKKRLQTEMKLILTGTGKNYEKLLSNYKYRNDVIVKNFLDEKTRSLFIGSAYGIILPGDDQDNQFYLLQAMGSAVPVIVSGDILLDDLEENTNIVAEPSDVIDLSEKMIRLYTDEKFRSEIVQKGLQISDKSDSEKYAAQLLDCLENTVA